ncbi:MAG: DUF1840 family protein, partial [Lautropia sp.]|nr:DUF1840 family protein [Lautropia sp.]
MLYEFRSAATGTVTMVNKTGRQILEIIGKSPDPTGIITVAQIPAAIAALEKAARAEPAPTGNEPDDQDQDERDDPPEPEVSLQQRVAPLIE